MISISLIISLIVLGLLIWVVDALLPMEPKIKSLIKILIIIVFVVWLLQYLGMLTGNPRL
jgi:hypothetical protein